MPRAARGLGFGLHARTLHTQARTKVSRCARNDKPLFTARLANTNMAATRRAAPTFPEALDVVVRPGKVPE